MSKEVVIKSDVKISRHCELNRFVDRVSTRLKHSSGLAIHNDIDIQAIAPNQMEGANFVQKPFHKSKFYIQAQEEYKNRGKKDPELIKKAAIRKSFLDQKNDLKRYQENMRCGHLDLDVVSFTIPMDPRRIAEIRHLYFVGCLPTNHKIE